MSLPHNGIMPPNRLANGQPIGYHPAQPQATNMPLSENLPIRTEPGHVANDGNAMQALGNGGSLREYQNESIDVDNEANNFSGGVNWKMQNKPIDLSIEPDEPGKMKKRKREKEIVLEQDQSPYRIPHAAKLRNSTTTSNQQGGNDGVTKTVFVDPLCQPRRGPTGPPMRPFSSPAPANSPIRRSPRHAKSKSRKVDIELTDSSKQAQVSDANVDVPLGGLGESTREVRAETSGFRSRSRSNSKRRRPNSETKVDSPPKESDGICRAEKRRNTTAVAKRRTKRDERKRKSRKQEPIKQTSMKPPTKASTREERTDEDSDEISEMMRKKKMPAIGSRLIPAQSHGDSPLSNTVGDASQSDDDSFGAVGNEISSDDDDDTSIKTPPQERRTRGKLSEAITISDSPEKRRTLRRPGSLGTAHTSPTARRPKTTGTSRGAASKSKAKDIAQDSDDEDFSDSSKGHANKTKNQSTRRRPRGSKTTKESNAPSSPVNLISPTPSRVPRNGTRRSPCTSKGMVSSQQKADDLVADSSDDDFTDKRVSARTRGKRKRRTPANDVTTSFYPEDWPSSLQRGAGSDERFNGVGKVDKSVQSADEDPESRFVSRSDEDSDVSAEFPSQEQGSQPIDLKVKIVSKRKKAGPKVYPEREFLKLSTDELSIIRVAFIKRYPSPPSNMQAQGRYEAAHGTAMTSGMIQRTWETQLKPWSKRWWDFYLDFNNKVREKKASKPRDKDPTLKESEVKSWVEEYYREHGDAKPNVTATATTTQASTNMESS